MELVKEDEKPEGTVIVPVPLQGIADLYVLEHMPGYTLEKWWTNGYGPEMSLVLQVRRT